MVALYLFLDIALSVASVDAWPTLSSPSSISTAATLALPTSANALSSAPTSTNPCGPVAAYYGQHEAAWDANNMDSWLNTWWERSSSAIHANRYGFAGAFGHWAIGNPDFSCQDDGSTSDCDFDPCANHIMNINSEAQQAYYVMESLKGLHTYFTGLREAFELSAIAAALSKDAWAETFYKDKDVKSVAALQEILNSCQTIVGISASLAALGGEVAGAIGGAANALFAGGAGATTPLMSEHQDDTFQKSADLGGILSNIVIGAMKSFTSANNVLMEGQKYQNVGDLRTYLSGGAFVNFGGVDKNLVTNATNAFLIGQAINQLWRTQKIFIMGGGACGDGQGIGSGPHEAMVCRNGQAWYLYYWQEDSHKFVLNSHKWGWVSSPPGADALGSGDYAGVTIQDVINSSLDAYNFAGYNYDNETAFARVQSVLKHQRANPGAQGPSWEGTFTIPVCDVSATINSTDYYKTSILLPYGMGNRPVWCGPVCGGDLGKTQQFIQAANMKNFRSPKHLCKHAPGY